MLDIVNKYVHLNAELMVSYANNVTLTAQKT